MTESDILEKKWRLAGLVLAIVLLAYFGFKINSQKKAIVLELDFGNGEKKVFYNYSFEEKKAWGLLQQVASISGLDLVADTDFTPKKIDGYLNGKDNKKWNFYVNGTKKEISPMDVVVKIPDKVVFRFE
jgi:hypothetical protein